MTGAKAGYIDIRVCRRKGVAGGGGGRGGLAVGLFLKTKAQVCFTTLLAGKRNK